MQVNPFPFKRPVRVEMIPLIDMFFLLLVFFIFGVFSMTMQQGMAVELPEAHTGAALQTDGLTISLSAEGALFLNQEPVALEALAGALRREALRKADEPVRINADRAVRHGLVMAVLDAARAAGLPKVSFHTLPEAP